MITKSLKKTTDDDDDLDQITKKSCESVEKVGSIDDLISEILLKLPASSLVRFKSVSKQWMSLITSTHLSRLHICGPLRLSGLFIPIDKTLKQPEYRYIPLNSSIPSRTITFPTDPACPNGIQILQSCNGLLFCTNSYGLAEYYVYNPTTGKFTTIPVPQLLARLYYRGLHQTTLAFDPLRSPHYKLVCAHRVPPTGKHQIEVYSSETQLWKVCGDQPSEITSLNGVYWNGAVHYMSYSHTRPSIYLKIDDDEQRLETMPMPPLPNNNKCIYFGQSGGRLHLIMAKENTAGHMLDVYEMENDYSKWSVRYQVELREVCRSNMMGIVRGEREEDSFLLFNRLVDGSIRFMKYTFADKTLKMLFEIQDPRGRLGKAGIISYASDYSKAFEFIQSLSPV